ncbi:transmembrane protein, putative (macronuclear) [Tetrahymena thermophila SB210]|uniref:Transmembrane protein, putative n=1 Tax=Tetrahymena thermophila (strain SB210) TaxID=312017 RepID=W7X4E8_TETTS|nr:transmembrane protein, putative [Tetrahymena thermophila SB210]EWS74190.1 transmembrane protein, putative [Tetrahymena thermophila SB210]|eukprot:XP_012653274.1 transmembrane protein, putative [Tetrahymena thermophila SB210]
MKVHQTQVLVQQISLFWIVIFLIIKTYQKLQSSFFFFFLLCLLFFVLYLQIQFIILFSNFAFIINQLIQLFHIFSSFFPSNKLFNDTFFLQYLKSSNQIGDKGASGLGSGLANCINLSNLTLDLGSFFFFFSYYCACFFFVLSLLTQFIILFSTFAFIINQLILLFHIFSSFFPSNQLFNDIFFLQYLKSFNQIGDEGVSGLGSGLAKCINLSNLRLFLQSNKIGAIGALNLGYALVNCKNLQNLTLFLDFKSMNQHQKLKVRNHCLKSKRLVVLKKIFC